jgi:hypothetical protein
MARSLKRIKSVDILSLHLDKNRFQEVIIRCQTIGDRNYSFSAFLGDALRAERHISIIGAPILQLSQTNYGGKFGLFSRYAAKEHKFALNRPSKRYMSGKVVILNEDSDA